MNAHKALESLKILRLHNFRWFVIGNTLGFLVMQMRTMAQNWLVLDLTDSSAWVGLVAGALPVTVMLLSPLAGVAADRMDRKRILALSRVLQATLVFATAMVISYGLVNEWYLLVLSIGAGIVLTGLGPSGETILIDVVGKERLLTANGLNLGISYIGRFVGPAAAGVLVAVYGMEETFCVIGVIVIVTLITYMKLKLDGPKKMIRKSPLDDFIEGLKYTFSRPQIALLVFMAGLSLLGGVYVPLVPTYARDILGVGSIGFGILEAASGLGAVLGTVCILLVGKVERKVRLVVFAAVLFGIGMVVFGVSRNFYLSIASQLMIGLATPVWMGSLRTVVQTTVEQEIRGRVMGIFFVALQFFGMGWLIGGLIAEIIGNETTLVLGGVLFASLNVLTYWRSAGLKAL